MYLFFFSCIFFFTYYQQKYLVWKLKWDVDPYKLKKLKASAVHTQHKPFTGKINLNLWLLCKCCSRLILGYCDFAEYYWFWLSKQSCRRDQYFWTFHVKIHLKVDGFEPFPDWTIKKITLKISCRDTVQQTCCQGRTMCSNKDDQSVELNTFL